MDGSSTLQSIRWKQLCACALSAASLLAGHLVFGQDAQSMRTGATIGQTTTPTPRRELAKAPEGALAPIIQGRPKPTTAAAPSLAPIVEQAGVPKPPALKSKKAAKGAATSSFSAGEPVATLELLPDSAETVATVQGSSPVAASQGSKTPSQHVIGENKSSTGSPWMVDINEALSRPNKPNESVAKSKASQPPKPSSPVSNSAFAPAAEPPTTGVGGGAYPAAQLGVPQSATQEHSPGNDTAKAVGQSAVQMPTPQYNPFAMPPRPGVKAPIISGRTKPAEKVAANKSAASNQQPETVSPVATKSPSMPAYGAFYVPSPNVQSQLQVTTPTPPAVASKTSPSPTEKGTPDSHEQEPTPAPIVPANMVSNTLSPSSGSPVVTNSMQPVVDGKNATHEPALSNRSVATDTVVQASSEQDPSGQYPVSNRGYAPTYQAEVPAEVAVGVPVPATPPQVGNRYASTPRLASSAGELGSSASTSAPKQIELAPANAQRDGGRPNLQFTQAEAPRPLPGVPAGPFEMIGESGTVSVMVRRSMLLRTRTDIYRTAVVDPGICDVVQFTPREISIIGKSQGSTHVTFWFDDAGSQPITYLVKVEPDSAEVKQEEDKYKLLEDVVNEMFPDSKIQLVLVADKLIVKGQAKDSEEATQIMAIIRTNANGGGGGSWGAGGWNGGGGLSEGTAADVLSDSATGSAARARYQVINMLRVPGVQQVALRVKIAELNRTAARGFGVDVQGNVAFSDSPEGTDLFFNSILNMAGGGAPALLAQFDGDDISIGIRYLQQQGVIRLLSEPTLVTMSGRPATFVAGGEFAVPTVVGSAGLNAVTTDFRAFGAIISFLPTVVDKDRVRLEVSPEFSQINNSLTVGGTPGLKTRAVTTTVEMREGQTLAIAGLLEDNMNGATVGDLPFLARVFGRRSMQRAETELIILVTPELIHAMEAEEVPPLPGFDVTEPDNCQFFLHGRIEGTPTREYRSTVWPRMKNRYKADGPAMTSGPFGHGQ
jgi:pilus assembly protein CpaC